VRLAVLCCSDTRDAQSFINGFSTKVISGISNMRRPLAVELSAEDRSLARRWVVASASFYWTIVIVIIIAMLASSTADKATVVTGSGQKEPRPGRAGLYGALPNPARLPTACTASQRCMVGRANGVGGAH
jgi:hypothetical protein